MRVILAQTNIVWENKNENIKKAIAIIDDAIDMSSVHPDLVLFPEMSFTGFSMNTDLTVDEGPLVRTMRSLAIDRGIAIGFGWTRKSASDTEKCENVYTILGSNGNTLSEYVKIHPFSYSGEDRFFVGGKRICLFKLCGISMASFICYDLRFPELFRAVCDKVHVIIVPACWPAKRSHHWKSLLTARAIENQVYILAVNCVGDSGGISYSGDSCVISPDGEILKSLSLREGIIDCILKDDVCEFRKRFPVLKDRREDLYSTF